MIWPFKRKFHTEHQWEYAPYAFEPGRKYVIEINAKNIELDVIKELSVWFEHNGLNVQLVLTRGNALQPIEVKGYKEVIE